MTAQKTAARETIVFLNEYSFLYLLLSGMGGSLLSGFRSGHNFWTLLSVGGRELLSEFYGTFKRR